MVGYFCLPAMMAGPVPGVAVLPEAPGLGPMPRKRAELLAGMGYAALAVDLYGGGLFTGYNEEAGAHAAAMLANPALLQRRAEAGLAALAMQRYVDPARLAAIGYCLGGKAVLDSARSGIELKGVIAYHGLLTPWAKAEPGAIAAKVLVFTGAEDPLVPLTEVAGFVNEMTTARADFCVTVYGGAGHAFTSFDVPRGTMPAKMGNFGFHAEADREAWAATEGFLKAAF